MNDKKATKAVLKNVSRAAMKFAVKSVNSSCHLWRFQPKESEKIKKLRKF